MQPSRVLFERMVLLFANNTATLNHVDPDTVGIGFISAPYTDTPNHVAGDLSYQTTQLDAGVILVADAAPTLFRDALSGDFVAKWRAESSDWLIKATTVTSTFTIYGCALRSNDHSVLLATQHVPTDIVIASNSQGAAVPAIEFRFPLTMVR